MYKIFSLNGTEYIYSAMNNKIERISKECSDFLSCVTNKCSYKDCVENCEMDFLTQNGFIGEYKPSFENNAIKFIDEHINCRRKYLVLQVTQRCNLICGYCPYACTDNDSRNHKNVDMSLDVAIRAVDDYLAHSRDIRILNFGFYGGEPLLNFDLICSVVEYIESKVKNKNIVFSMTTNGTLLTKSIVEYLVKKDFRLTISLDGDKSLHDKHRKFPNQKGSHSIVYSAMKYIYEKYSEFWMKNVSFNAVVNSYMDFNRSLSFFNSEKMYEEISGIRINFSEGRKLGVEIYDEKIINKFTNVNRYNNKRYYLELMLFYYQRRIHCPDYISDDIDVLKKIDLKQHNDYNSCKTVVHPQGQCISGATKLMVDVYGNYWPCEKINETCGFCKIGDVYSGVDKSQVAKQMNVSMLTKDECLRCWAINHCSFCLANFNEHSCITEEIKLQKCKKEKERLLGLIKIYTTIQNVYSKYGYKEGIEL